ncbi:MAG: FumA C-terminus/TtdB family hydratase beta subunit [Nanoarchaeota archaeon]
MIRLNTPISDEEIRKLRVGNKVLISGIMFTGRDQVHKYLTEKFSEEFKEKLQNSVLYHCGPVVKKVDKEYKIIAAGPTTSIREEPYEADIIKNYKVKAIIGKGGMAEKTLKSCSENGAVYLSAIGGLGALLAERIKKVTGVDFLEEFGIPEAMWQLDVVDFPCIVTMDSHGNNLHEDILKTSKENYNNLIK